MHCPRCLFAKSEMLFKVGDRLFQTTPEQFEIRRCGKCHILFLFPQPDLKDSHKYYPEGYWMGPTDKSRTISRILIESYRKAVLFNHVRFVKQVIQKHRQSGKIIRLLDVGCGDGSFLETCKIRPCTGLDMSAGAVRSVKSRGIDAIQGSLTDNPFKEKSFSTITMFHFLEHIPIPEICLNVIKNLLTDNGDLIVQVPNAASWQARLLKKKWIGYDVPRHMINYSPETLCRTLSQNGFKIIRQSQFSLRDDAPMVAMSLFPSLYPPARQSRIKNIPKPEFSLDPSLRLEIRRKQTMASDFIFLGITLGALPFTLIESLMGHGATVMVHAKSE